MLSLRIDTNQENYFPKDHPIRKASNIINSSFGGSQTISVMISGDIKSPETMKKIDDLTSQLIDHEGVGSVFSISRVVREMTRAIYNKDEQGYDRIPESREGIAQLFELYNMSGDQGDFDQLMNTDNTRAHMLIKMSDSDNSIITRVKDLIDSQLRGTDAEVTVGGYAIIMADFAESIIRGQILSLLFAVITVFLLLTIIFRSVRGGLIGTIPLSGSILIVFGFMGYTGIALDAATALLSSIMIGVGVDFTIQYIWSYNSHLVSGLNYAEATRKALGTMGRSIFINAFTVMAGFSALMLSGFTSIRFFGYLVFISIGSCLIGAVIVIPAFLVKFRPGFIEKDLTRKKRIKHEKESEFITVTTAAFASGNGSAT
jgi:predicted RND superfamily exporter protein